MNDEPTGATSTDDAVSDGGSPGSATEDPSFPRAQRVLGSKPKRTGLQRRETRLAWILLLPTALVLLTVGLPGSCSCRRRSCC
jgi:hypothetical protein